MSATPQSLPDFDVTTALGTPGNLEAQQILAQAQAELFGDPGPGVGRYEIVRKLGAGGMGVVYEAYDPVLDCKVALKQLRPELAAEPGFFDNLRREARAMAKLRAERNVATLYDFFVQNDVVFVVMEFIEGSTLRTWQKGRSQDELLDAYLQAGRGLAAAHAAGIVHRDFKPENVMVGADGRVRVMDFGLARSSVPVAAELERTRPGSGEGALPSPLTRSGALVGTPRYMAPEQWNRGPTDARTDQFAHCLALWEALYGAPAFRGVTMAELALAVTRGAIEPPPAGTRVPAWLHRVLLRGLATDPGRRFASMEELLTALGRGQARTRTRRWLLGLCGVGIAVGCAAGLQQLDRSRRVAACEVAGAAITEVWNEGAREGLRRAFMATGVGDAEATARRVVPWLDRQAAAWQSARTDACLNADVHQGWGAELADRAVWCLEERQSELQSLVEELGRADATAVQKAVSAATALSAIEGCVDEGLLLRRPAPPVRGREVFRELRDRLARAHSLGLAGNYEAAVAGAREVGAAPESREWPPLWAAARAREGLYLEKSGVYEEAEKASGEAYFEAARSSAWDVAAVAATQLVITVGMRREQHAEGRLWAKHAKMAIDHAGDPLGLLEAERLNGLAGVQRAAGVYGEARRLYEEALALRVAALGPDHPFVAAVLNNLAAVHGLTGNYPEARALLERAVVVQEQALGADHPAVAQSTSNLAIAHLEMGDLAKARALHERALAVRERALGREHPDVAMNLDNLANVHQATGAYAEARALHERALAIYEKTLGPDHPRLADSLSNLARVCQLTGALDEAQALQERALAILEKALGPDHPNLAVDLANLGALHLREKRADVALPLLERAVAIVDGHEGVQEAEFSAYLSLAEALVTAGGDRDRALALARRARDLLREAGASEPEERAAVERFLAEHDPER